jgi:hypothetical protein
MIDDGMSMASDNIVKPFLADQDLHHLHNKATVWLALPPPF